MKNKKMSYTKRVFVSLMLGVMLLGVFQIETPVMANTEDPTEEIQDPVPSEEVETPEAQSAPVLDAYQHQEVQKKDEGESKVPGFEAVENPVLPLDPDFVIDSDLSKTAGYDIYSYTNMDDEVQYRAYGKDMTAPDPSVVIGWYHMKDTGEINYAKTNPIEDIEVDVLNLSKNGFKELSAPSSVPEYYSAPMIKDGRNTIYNRARFYAFTGRDGSNYGRLYGTIAGKNEGFYNATNDGNIIAPSTKIDLVEEDKTLKPIDNKPGGSLVSDGAYISSASIASVADGSASWDENDILGNDSGPNNKIVRSFDTIAYTFDLNIQVQVDGEYTSFTDGDIYVKYVLPFEKSIAEFDLAAMNWLVDGKVTNEDGKQVLRGKRHIDKGLESVAIPSAKQLTAVIKVNGAANNQIIKPEFTMWMDGNEEDPNHVSKEAKYVLGDDTKVSAAPKYNVKLERNTFVNDKLTVDFDSGNIATESSTNTMLGRMQGYGVTIQLYNDKVEKGLKGIELPKGAITLDLELSYFRQELGNVASRIDVTKTLTPQLWDYKINTVGTKGKLGRNMLWTEKFNSHTSSTSAPLANKNEGGNPRNLIKNVPGKVDASQTLEKIQVTFDEYKFDTFSFPTNNFQEGDTADIRYGNNVGCFTAGYFQIVAPLPTADKNYEYGLTIKDTNFNANSLSNQNTKKQTVTTDDSVYNLLPELLPGGFSKLNSFGQNDSLNWANKFMSTRYGYGDSWSYNNRDIKIWGGIKTATGDPVNQDVHSFNLLQKFDDKAFEIPLDSNGKPSLVSHSRGASTVKNVKMLYAAKPDKTGWSSASEINKTREESLVYFASIGELNAAGYTCVAVLFEGREGIIPGATELNLAVNVRIKKDAVIGEVYQTINDLKIWTEKNKLPEDMSRLNTATFPKQNAFISIEYTKAQYEEGVLSSGHDGGFWAGNSLLVVGNMSKISKDVEQTSGSNEKLIFDLDSGQRVADFVLKPSLQYANGLPASGSDKSYDNVTIVDELPPELTYIEGSSYQGGTYMPNITATGTGEVVGGIAFEPNIEIKTNADGKDYQVLTWILPNQEVGKLIEPFHYAATIGKIAEPNKDVVNSQSFKNTVSIFADNDGRVLNVLNGNIADKGISVIKTKSAVFTKTIDKNMYEIGGDIEFALNYGNASTNTLGNVKLLDTLPYNGDWRKTKFDGSYTIESMKVEYTTNTVTPLEVRMISDKSVQNKTNTAYNTNVSSWGVIAPSGTGKVFTYNFGVGVTPTAIQLNGDLEANTSIKISYTLKVKDNKPANIYANDATVVAGSSTDVLYAPTVQAKVARRSIEGVTWLDANRNGKRESNEKRLSGIKVELFDSSGTQVTTDLLGNDLTKEVSNSTGAYEFTNLEAGKYTVKFSSGTNIDLTNYELTIANAPGVSATYSSNAIGNYDVNGVFESATIPNLVAIELSQMKLMDTKISYQDAGFYADFGFSKTSDPLGSIDGSGNPVPILNEGEVVTYTLNVDTIVEEQAGVIVSDKLPEGMSFVQGTIKYTLAGGSEVSVDNSAYNALTHTITYPSITAPIGTSSFSFKAIVNKLDAGVYEKEFKNTAIAKQEDREKLSETIVHQVISRKAEISKTAILIDEDDNYLVEDRGTQANPVYSELEQSIEYRLLVSNEGNINSKSGDLVVSDTLPLDTVYEIGSMNVEFRDSADPTQPFAGSTATATMSEPNAAGLMTWTLNGMSSGEEAYLTFKVAAPITSDDATTPSVKELEKEFENTAHLYDKQLDGYKYGANFVDGNGMVHSSGEKVYKSTSVNKDSETTYHVVKEPLLEIEKSSDPKHESIVNGDDVITYTLTVTNSGKANAKLVNIKDAIPSGTTYVEGSITSDRALDTTTDDLSETLTWNVSNLEVDGVVNVSFQVKVNRLEVSGENTITNSGYTKLDTATEWLESNEIQHYQNLKYKIEKSSNPESGSYVKSGENITYFITLTNMESETLYDAVITDTIPEFTTYVEGSIASTMDNTEKQELGASLKWTVKEVKAGESVTLSFRVGVDKMDTKGKRTLVNVAQVKVGKDDEKPTNEVKHYLERSAASIFTGDTENIANLMVLGILSLITLIYIRRIKENI